MENDEYKKYMTEKRQKHTPGYTEYLKKVGEALFQEEIESGMNRAQFADEILLSLQAVGVAQILSFYPSEVLAHVLAQIQDLCDRAREERVQRMGEKCES